MGQPYEIIMSPFEVYVANVGTAFPLVNATPSAAAWTLLGTNGKYNQTEDGVTVNHEQTINKHRTGGSTGPVKATRTEEDLSIELTLEDLTLEVYGRILNNVAASKVNAASGIPGTRSIPLRMGQNVAEFAMLVKGTSPYGDGLSMQYQVPRAIQEGNPSPTFAKGGAAGLACKFSALEDPNAGNEDERFGTLVAQDADATA